MVRAGLAIALAGLPLLANADVEIHARGWTHQGYGRLVLDDAARVTSSVDIRGHRLVIAFSEPVSIEFGSALHKLGTYLQGPSTAEGRTLELQLVQPVTLGQFVEDNKLVLDLRPALAWPAERPDAVTDDMADEGIDDQAEQLRAELADEAASFETGAGQATEPETPTAQLPAAKTELAPIPNVTAAPTRIVARHGNHGTFVRLAIDWPG
jgi:hypothetical protein